MDPRTLLKLLGIAVLLAAVLVAARLVYCLVIAVRARRYPILAVSILGLVAVVAQLAALVVVWFGYAVAHIEKTASSDLMVFLMTVPPYFLVSLVLWWLGGKLLARLRPRATANGASGPPAAAPREQDGG